MDWGRAGNAQGIPEVHGNCEATDEMKERMEKIEKEKRKSNLLQMDKYM